MKKIVIMLGVIFIIICLFFVIKFIKNNNDNKRYLEIKDNVKKAVEWNIRVQYPYCTISNTYDKELKTGVTSYNSSFLIGNGYIKKSELLDVDKKSYCDVYVKNKVKYDNPLDHQKDCTISYKIYLKCNNYEDKGYLKWDN